MHIQSPTSHIRNHFDINDSLAKLELEQAARSKNDKDTIEILCVASPTIKFRTVKQVESPSKLSSKKNTAMDMYQVQKVSFDVSPVASRNN